MIINLEAVVIWNVFCPGHMVSCLQYDEYGWPLVLKEVEGYRKTAAATRAVAVIKGGPLAPEINGVVYFRNVPGGCEVYAEVRGLPPYRPAVDGKSQVGPHGFHIHSIGNCTVGNPASPFEASGGHWNPTNQPHGNHAGDFPVLFSNNGYDRMSFFTNKFKVADIIGKSVIIHEGPDDYRTQPAGGSGRRLACGVIVRA